MRNKELGFIHLSLWGVGLYLVSGWRGNLYRENRALRLDWGVNSGVHRLKLTWYSRGKETIVYLYRFLQPWRWTWNSEHLACRYGQDASWTHGPEAIVWRSRIFGYHIYV